MNMLLYRDRVYQSGRVRNDSAALKMESKLTYSFLVPKPEFGETRKFYYEEEP